MGAGVEQVPHHTQLDAFAVDDALADQIHPVELVRIVTGGEVLARDKNSGPFEAFCRSAVAHFGTVRHQRVRMGFDFGDGQQHRSAKGFELSIKRGGGNLQIPLGRCKQSIRFSGVVCVDFHPAFDAPSICNTTQLNGIFRQLGRF